MSDEIKEILEDLGNKNKYIEEFGYQYKRISLYDSFQLLDYITNLQEENENLLKKSYKDDVIITKAIKYVKNELYVLGIRDNRKQRDELLNILTGGDKE